MDNWSKQSFHSNCLNQTTHTNYSSDSKTQDKKSPVSQLAQLERDQKLRQEVDISSPSCALTEIVNEEKSFGH